MRFLRREGHYNIYEFDCPKCKVVGEIGVPVDCTKLFMHECGVIFIQKQPTGKWMWEKPKLEVIE